MRLVCIWHRATQESCLLRFPKRLKWHGSLRVDAMVALTLFQPSRCCRKSFLHLGSRICKERSIIADVLFVYESLVLSWRRHETWFTWLWLDVKNGSAVFSLIIYSSCEEAVLLRLLQTCYTWCIFSQGLLRTLLRPITIYGHGMLFKWPLLMKHVLLGVNFSLLAECLRRASSCLGGRLITCCCKDVYSLPIYHCVSHVVDNSSSLQYFTLRRLFEISIFTFVNRVLSNCRLNRLVLLCPL